MQILFLYADRFFLLHSTMIMIQIQQSFQFISSGQQVFFILGQQIVSIFLPMFFKQLCFEIFLLFLYLLLAHLIGYINEQNAQKSSNSPISIVFEQRKSLIKYNRDQRTCKCYASLNKYLFFEFRKLLKILSLCQLGSVLLVFESLNELFLVQLGHELIAIIYNKISLQHKVQCLYFIILVYNMPAIDKVVVYGVASPQKLKLSQILTNKINVALLEVYSSPGSHNTQHLQKIDFEMWAYPDGIKIYNNNIKILNDTQPQFSFFEDQDLLQPKSQSRPPQYIYSFVLTDYELTRTYCTCIIWNERYYIKDDRNQFKNYQFENRISGVSEEIKKILLKKREHYSLAVPKCKVETMINNPLILDMNSILVYIPKAMIVCSKKPYIQFQRSMLKYYYKNILFDSKGKQKKIIKIPRILQSQFTELIRNFGYPKAQTIFNEAQTETIRKIQVQLLKNSMKDPYRNKLEGSSNIQVSKLKQFFVSSFFTVSDQKKSTMILTECGERIASIIQEDTVFHPPMHFDFFSPDFKIEQQPNNLLPLPIPEFIQLWKCLLLEKQIIIFSNSQHKTLTISQIMLHLIQPIKWENIYIPFLPFHLSHHVDAIGGYLIGMSRIHMDYMIEKFDMTSKVVVDLHHNTILEQGGKDVIELPDQVTVFLTNSLRNICQSFNESKKQTKGFINYFITNLQHENQNESAKNYESYVSAWLQIQKTFFHALVFLFNNFIPFISKKDDGIIAVRTEQYLNILNDPLHTRFMKQISKTMVFIRLCQYHVEESQRCAWVQKTIGELFVYSHDILSHKFIVLQSEKRGIEGSSEKEQKKGERRQTKAYAWKIQDLLSPHQKYNQYIEYLFEKNSKEIANKVKTSELYLREEEKKYRILGSENQFESFEYLEEIQMPANFGSKNKNKLGQRSEKDLDEKKIYAQIHNQEILKSKKQKKIGERDQEEIYEEFSKVCKQIKIQKHLVKYLKYYELIHPEFIERHHVKRLKKQKNKNGILNWLWDIINPPEANRSEQQSELKSKLAKKALSKNIKIETALDLNFLFDHLNNGRNSSQVDKDGDTITMKITEPHQNQQRQLGDEKEKSRQKLI